MNRQKLHVFLAAALGASCLPSDTRPVPGSLLVSVQGSDATAHGFTTADGWTIELHRVVTAVGNVQLNNYPDQSTSCNDYSDARYDRLFDFTKVTSPQKVGLVFGLGKCSVEYRFRAPTATVLLETGTTQADVTFMRTQATDVSYGIDARVGLIVQGTAVRNGTTKWFDWNFRKGFTIEKCLNAAGTSPESVVDIHGKDALTLLVEIRAEELFRTVAKDDAPLGFDVFASADTTGLGEVSLDALASIPLPPGSVPSGSGGAGGMGGMGGAGGGAATSAPATFGDFVYDVLLPRVTRLAGGGECTASLRTGG